MFLLIFCSYCTSSVLEPPTDAELVSAKELVGGPKTGTLEKMSMGMHASRAHFLGRETRRRTLLTGMEGDYWLA